MNHRVLSGPDFLRALADAGIIDPDERVRKVVIEATAGLLTVIHVEHIGDERLLKVVREGGLRVVEAPPSAEESSGIHSAPGGGPQGPPGTLPGSPRG